MVTNQQLHAETVFQPFDGRGDRGLGDVQLARGLGHAAALDGGDEVFQLTQIVGSHSEPRGRTTQASRQFARHPYPLG
ncbi:hypothetical protein D9M73_214810 [compost metagenome]